MKITLGNAIFCAGSLLLVPLVVADTHGGKQVTFACADASADNCPYQFDKQCDVRTGVCNVGTDCFDCDPCQQFSGTSCEECTLNGCYWCGKDAICLSYIPDLGGDTGGKVFMCGAEEDFVAEPDICSSDSFNPFLDPLYDSMYWVYDLINVEPVWELGITGAGISVRINDDGVDAFHPDFSSKFDASSSCSIYLPAGTGSAYSHGTTCAAISAGSANDSCSVGIAPDATLSGCRIVPTNDDDILAEEGSDGSYLFAPEGGEMHVSSNSFGIDACESLRRRRHLQSVQCPFREDASGSPCLDSSSCSGVDWGSPSDLTEECEEEIIEYCQESFEDDVGGCIDFLDLFVDCEYNSLSEADRQGLIEGITHGRDGKGIIYVFAAGNEYQSGANVNFEGTLNTRFTIVVGSVGKFGFHASYSGTGAALFVSAPGGDDEFYGNHMTALAGGGCYDAGVGTSYAAPVVSGVVALMLQVRPDLGWRDVQGILATSSWKVDQDDPSWLTNAAGLHHSTKYGFGLVDADAAVQVAVLWENFGPEKQFMAQSGTMNVPIPDDPSAPATSAVTINTFFNAGITENVVVYLDLSHGSRGDLDIVLTSPSGTKSLLHPGKRPENTQDDERWKLMTVQAWGEPADGEWTLSLADVSEGHAKGAPWDSSWGVDSEIFGLRLTCPQLEVFEVCLDGGAGPNIDILLNGGYTGLDDPSLAGDEDGLTPDEACVACGGPLSSDIPAVLRSWKLMVYGHSS